MNLRGSRWLAGPLTAAPVPGVVVMGSMYTCAMAIPAHTPAQCWFSFILRAISFARFISFRLGPLARMPWSPHRHALRAFIFDGFDLVSLFFSSLSVYSLFLHVHSRSHGYNIQFLPMVACALLRVLAPRHPLRQHGLRAILRQQRGDPVPRGLLRQPLQLRSRSPVFFVSPDNSHTVPRVVPAVLAVLRQAAWLPKVSQVRPYHRWFLPFVPVRAHAHLDRFDLQLSLEALDLCVCCQDSPLWLLQGEAPFGVQVQVMQDARHYLSEGHAGHWPWHWAWCHICMHPLPPTVRQLQEIDDCLCKALGREMPP